MRNAWNSQARPSPRPSPHRWGEGEVYRSIGPIGTASRVLVGLILFSIGVAYAISGSSAWWQLSLGLVGFPVLTTLFQLAHFRLTRSSLHETGSLASCINCAAVIALLLAWPTRNATLIFLGAAMLLSAVRGYCGCETLAVSNWLLGRDDQVGCLVFSPIDALEANRRR